MICPACGLQRKDSDGLPRTPAKHTANVSTQVRTTLNIYILTNVACYIPIVVQIYVRHNLASRDAVGKRYLPRKFGCRARQHGSSSQPSPEART